jgi:SAM-dependent methyltransferase
MGDGRFSSLRLASFYEFVVSQLPFPAKRVLEVGCGGGELAVALAAAGYRVTAVDPEAPEGSIFRRSRLEDFSDDRGFDGVIASVSLHHVEDPASALDKIAGLLRRGGVLILEEFAKERLTGATARWYYHQRRALAAVGVDDSPIPDEFETWERRWTEDHVDIHPFAALRREIDLRFAERYFATVPYLFDYSLDDALEPLERELIAAGRIEATGVRYVGELSTVELDGASA